MRKRCDPGHLSSVLLRSSLTVVRPRPSAATAGNKETQERKPKRGPVRAVAVAPDCETAISGCFDTSAIRWSIKRNAAEQVLRRARGYAPHPVQVAEPLPPILAVGALGMFAAMIGSFLVRAKGDDDLAAALHRGTNFSLIATAAGVLGLSFWVFGDVAENPLGIWFAVLAGLIVGWMVGKISEWFTSDDYKTVKEIARQSQTGPATVIISGVAEGMRSAAYSVIVVAAGIGVAFVARMRVGKDVAFGDQRPAVGDGVRVLDRGGDVIDDVDADRGRGGNAVVVGHLIFEDFDHGFDIGAVVRRRIGIDRRVQRVAELTRLRVEGKRAEIAIAIAD